MSPEIIQWAIRHHVSLQALHELQGMFGMHGGHSMPAGHKGTSEAAAQAAVRLEASQKGVRLFRNNVGALKDERGVPVRYGLANESAEVNKVIKSSDLVGWRRRLIVPADLGAVIAQTVLREVKEPGWTYSGNEHEVAQLAWLQLGASDGADVAFCTGVGTL